MLNADGHGAYENVTVLHSCDRYRVRYNKAARHDVTVVTFEPWYQEPRTLEGRFFGEDFFAKRGISAIGIKASRNDWYLGSAMRDVVGAVKQAAAGTRVVTYGASMGGYAAINYAADLGADLVLAVGPQFSIDPAKAPFDQRYLREAGALTFEQDQIGRQKPIRQGLIVYDAATVDARHAALIGSFHNLVSLRLAFADHHPLAILQDCGLLERLVLETIEERLDLPSFVRAVRERRRHCAWVWLHMSKHLESRGHVSAALGAVLRAKEMVDTARFPIDVQQGTLLMRLGQAESARTLVLPYLDDPLHGPAARWYLETWDWQAAQHKGSGPLTE